jgi:hypothetical protein
MSTETTQEHSTPTDEQIVANSPFKHAIHIARNGVTEVLKVFVGKRSDWEGRPYAAIQLEEEASKETKEDTKFLNGITFLGKGNVVKMLNTILRRYGQDAVEDAYDGENAFEGNYHHDVFTKGWENFAAAGLRISELKEQLDAEQLKHQEYISTVAMAAFGNPATTPEEIASIKKTIQDRTATINDLRFQLEQRSQKKSKEKNVEETMNKA